MNPLDFNPDEVGSAVVSDGSSRGRMASLSRPVLVGQGASRLAQLLLDACHQHRDIAEMVQRSLSDSAEDDQVGPDEVRPEPVMVGACPAMKEMFHSIRRYAPNNSPVLITGESGTGKELAAVALHERSPFHDGPFVPVNCGGLPATLVASELFGHEKGTFTGAVTRHIGHIERANGGTLFLDEIGDLPMDLQAHFLRFLETRVIERLGGTHTIPANARIIAATNIDLENAVSSGRFRRDLFFRLDVLRIHLPPLRERGDDIEVLVKFFKQRLADELGIPERNVSARAIEALKAYHWPGNIRELISKIRRAIVTADGKVIDIGDLELNGRPPKSEAGDPAPVQTQEKTGAAIEKTGCLSDVRRQAEADAIRSTLEQNRYNVTKAARQLGIGRATIYKRMKKLGIQF
jgi:DNA-binding NtrC family response regulator